MARRISVEIVGDSKSVERAFKRAGSAGSSFGQRLRSIGKAATLGVGAAFLGVGLALRRGFGELAEAQKVAAQTGAVLRSTGGVANVSAKQVDKLATSISRMSGIDDEAIAGAQNFLLTFTNIRNEAGKGNRVFDRTTRAAIDMAQALGMDVNSAAMMVGKALNQMDVTAQGNVRGFMALRRVGVQISPTMMAAAKAFIEAGKPMEAQKLLLRELQTEFGGSAAAFGTTMPGALGKLNNALDEVMAAFAQGFLPIILKVANALTTKLADPAFVQRISNLGTLIGTKLYNAFAAIGTWFAGNWPQIKQGFQTAALAAGKIGEAIQNLVKVFKASAPIIAALIQFSMLKPLGLVLQAFSGVLEGLSRMPFVGDKFKGSLEAVNTVREGVRAGDQALTNVREGRTIKGGTEGRRRGASAAASTGIVAGQGRALGGPAFAGMTYRVGERRAEMLTMGSSSGHISAAGGGGVSIGVLNLNGVQSPQQFLKELQRIANTNAASRRGRYGGSNLALG